MNSLLAGIAMIIIGLVLVLFYNQQVKKGSENPVFEKPYLKNVGIGLLLFGVYYLTQFLMK